nr:dUTP diphosphatase [Paracoccaceae bacterium]
MVEITFVWEEGADRALGLPHYATPGAAGADLRANLLDRGVMILAPGARA